MYSHSCLASLEVGESLRDFELAVDAASTWARRAQHRIADKSALVERRLLRTLREGLTAEDRSSFVDEAIRDVPAEEKGQLLALLRVRRSIALAIFGCGAELRDQVRAIVRDERRVDFRYSQALATWLAGMGDAWAIQAARAERDGRETRGSEATELRAC